MKQYRLPVTMCPPSEDTEYKYMAEVPVLPGCRAWGDTPQEALANPQSVAGEFILSYRAHGHHLPKAVEETAYELVGDLPVSGAQAVERHISLVLLAFVALQASKKAPSETAGQVKERFHLSSLTAASPLAPSTVPGKIAQLLSR